MRIVLIFILVLFVVSCSKSQSECDEVSEPYWFNGINSRVKGENIAIRKAFKEIQLSEAGISPRDGLLTLRLHIGRTGQLCDIETFQIDDAYNTVSFNDGKLARKLEVVAASLRNWERDREYKTYNLIRFRIKNGKIAEVF